VPTDRLRTAGQMAPYCIETGTPNFAAMEGVSAAVDFLASLGSGDTKREKLVDAYRQIAQHEHTLASRLYAGLKSIAGLTVVGQDFTKPSRTPTVSFTLDGKTPHQVCEQLAKKNICAWDGHFYAIRTIETLGLLEKGGVTRLGLSVYNTEDEVTTVIEEIKKIALAKN